MGFIKRQWKLKSLMEVGKNEKRKGRKTYDKSFYVPKRLG